MARAESVSNWLPALFGSACGIIVANLYFTQPLAGLVIAALGLPKQSAGLLTTLPLIGYGAGLLTIVPLGDLVENRSLVLWLVALEAICLLLLSLAVQPIAFLTLGFFIGVTAAVVQVLVPYSTYLVPEEARGRTLGQVVSGLMLGIMLSRPVASMIADFAAWRVVYRFSASLMGRIGYCLADFPRPILPTLRCSDHSARSLQRPRFCGAEHCITRAYSAHSALFGLRCPSGLPDHSFS
jgi:predicted MFS family arabinose efflux permease